MREKGLNGTHRLASVFQMRWPPGAMVRNWCRNSRSG